jgi:uncharacterized protein (AIM24 family)
MEYQIIGNGDIKHLAVTLDPRDEFFVEKGALIYYEGGIDPAVFFNGRGIKKILGAKLSGESILILSLKNIASAPRKVAIAASCGMFEVELHDETLICRSGAYIASLDRVNITSKFSLRGLIGGLGIFLQQIHGSTTVFLETNGNPLVIDLAADEHIITDENHIIALQGIPTERLTAKWSVNNLLAGKGLSLMRIDGPGRVYLSPASFMGLGESPYDKL